MEGGKLLEIQKGHVKEGCTTKGHGMKAVKIHRIQYNSASQITVEEEIV